VATDLSGKPIAITGASSGIGRAAALACAEAGMPVVVNARRRERLEALVAEIEEGGGSAHLVAGDVSDPAVGERLVGETVDRFGSIFAVFANAGYGVEGATHELSLDEHRGIFDVNYFGTLNTVIPAVRPMRDAGEGRIVICSSCVSHFPLAFYGAYSATKAAQHHIGRAMSVELRGSGVRVTTIHPVGTQTEFFGQAASRSVDPSLVSRGQEDSMQSPARVAEAVLRAMRRPRPEAWLSQPTRIGFILAMLAPRLTEAALTRALRHRRNKRGASGRRAGEG